MTFSDIFKKSFLTNYAGMGTKQIVLTLFFASIIGLYIFFCYRIINRKTFYSRNFNIALVVVTVITTAIILSVQSSVVISLGMVGALSIVRFRTAIKDPMDLAFIFWSISVGIICGAGLTTIAILMSIVVTGIIVFLNFIPATKPSKILVVNYKTKDGLDKIIDDVIRDNARYYEEKTKRIMGDATSTIYELRVKDEMGLIKGISNLQGIDSFSLLSHDGEITL